MQDQQTTGFVGKLDLKKNGLWGWVIYQGDLIHKRSEQLYTSKERADEALSLIMQEITAISGN